ncbi:MAG TPA: hypothetical protein VK338_05180 [Candidatus Nitrosocosmicus sp.]|nr:hypothetical protein [Candidatus Nitrosocosmicus sp.]
MAKKKAKAKARKADVSASMKSRKTPKSLKEKTLQKTPQKPILDQISTVPTNKKNIISESSFPYTNTVIGIVVVGIIMSSLLYFAKSAQVTNNKLTTATVNTQLKSDIKLPLGWEITQPEAGISYKFVKNTNTDVTPTIVLIRTVANMSDPEKYVNTLLEGTKSALPNLILVTNKTTPVEGYYLRELSGSYNNGQNQVQIQQRIYIRNNQVTTLTASYVDVQGSTTPEVTQIFNSLFEKHIKS